MGKQVEGDNRERRKRAREARLSGHTPSGEEVTLGASKQREHLGRSDDPTVKKLARRKGKRD